MKNNKLVVILGPTASGKTNLSIKLAKKFGGEIISADSRQVYKGLNIGSGKITKKEMQGIPHHLLDVANPARKFSVAQFQKLALKKIKETQKRNSLPFLVGGSGFYLQSIVDGISIPEVAPNWKLRKNLGKKTVEELFLMLKKLDSIRAENIDAKNPHRLIRAIEIARIMPVPIIKRNTQFNILQIGIKKSPEELKKLIKIRLQKRINGIITEVRTLTLNGVEGLKNSKLSFKRLEELGLEYRFVARLQRYAQHCGQAQYYEKKREIMVTLQKEIEHFAKRQMTWFRKDKRIIWLNVKSAEDLDVFAEKITKDFL